MEKGRAINEDEYRTQLPILRYSSKFCLRILRYRIRNSSGPLGFTIYAGFQKNYLMLSS